MKQSVLFGPRYLPIAWLAGIALLISFLTRLILIISFPKTMEAGFVSILLSFIVGLLFDIIVTGFILIPLILQVTFSNDFIYTKKGKWLAITFFLAILCILLFSDIVPRDFNRDLYKAATGYVVVRFAIYLALLSTSPATRYRWRSFILQMLFVMIVFCLLFNAISEWFFWDEFSSRYNFITVDYLVYTNEVLGNIRESYPVFWLIGLVAAISILILFCLRKIFYASVKAPMLFSRRLLVTIIILIVPLLSIWLVNPQWKNFSTNNYANELAGNGPYEFVQAFKNNELDFYRYYQTIPDKLAFRIVRNQLASPFATFTGTDSFSIERTIHYSQPENKMNVVLISVESLSASFMGCFGNAENLTPQIDLLASKGLLFTNAYASGTRTVRGLEALALSIPPTPGQSLVKRPANENLFSLGHVFKTKGYNTQFIYGGFGYFDNMNYFFGHNEYQVIDRSSLLPSEIHYANIWGVADEDLFTLALRSIETNSKTGKPFFTQIMTVSNHKPYTYPKNRIDIPPGNHSREGAVKYTDYAIGDFIKRASLTPWFRNTLFVIVADHCASSAGSTALPVTGYHIPLIVYSPALLKPERIAALTAQIDIAPTILGLLHLSYTSKFFGQDVLNTRKEKQHAFISTYQGLGFISNNYLVLQSPVNKVTSYRPDFLTGKNTVVSADANLVQSAIANYQVAAWLIKHKKYNVR